VHNGGKQRDDGQRRGPAVNDIVCRLFHESAHQQLEDLASAQASEQRRGSHYVRAIVCAIANLPDFYSAVSARSGRAGCDERLALARRRRRHCRERVCSTAVIVCEAAASPCAPSPPCLTALLR
jgi:hypothetical protein